MLLESNSGSLRLQVQIGLLYLSKRMAMIVRCVAHDIAVIMEM